MAQPSQMFGRGPQTLDWDGSFVPAVQMGEPARPRRARGWASNPEDVAPMADASVPDAAPEDTVGSPGFTALAALNPSHIAALNTPAEQRTPQQVKLLNDRAALERMAVQRRLPVKAFVTQALSDQTAVRNAELEGRQDARLGIANARGSLGEFQKAGLAPSPMTRQPLVAAPAPGQAASSASASAAQPKQVGYALRQMPDGTFRSVSGSGLNQEFRTFQTENEATNYFRPPAGPMVLNSPAGADAAAPAAAAPAAAPVAPVAPSASEKPAIAPALAAPAPTAQDLMTGGSQWDQPSAMRQGFARSGLPGAAATVMGRFGDLNSQLWNQTVPNAELAAASWFGPKVSRVAHGLIRNDWTPRELPSADTVSSATPSTPRPDSLLQSAITNPFTAPSTKIRMTSKKLGTPRAAGFQANYPDAFSSLR